MTERAMPRLCLSDAWKFLSLNFFWFALGQNIFLKVGIDGVFVEAFSREIASRYETDPASCAICSLGMPPLPSSRHFDKRFCSN
jgi:hypothetical protein